SPERPNRLSSVSRRLSSAPPANPQAPVKGYLRNTSNTRNPISHKKWKNLEKYWFVVLIQ
ncbi:MAG: hypothetical protein AB3N21_16745, partial [Ruegeria sp.]|uniref:hypothetical protein n=1 Tax=Ruegeria sp. TaxID=1879320 RepID=UPI00349E9895